MSHKIAALAFSLLLSVAPASAEIPAAEYDQISNNLNQLTDEAQALVEEMQQLKMDTEYLTRRLDLGLITTRAEAMQALGEAEERQARLIILNERSDAVKSRMKASLDDVCTRGSAEQTSALGEVCDALKP